MPDLPFELVAQVLGARLRALRHAKGLSQIQVAEAAGIARNHYQLLEAGRSDRARGAPANPRLSTLMGLAYVFDTTVARLTAKLPT